ncbi:MAG: type I DNA topoisomerase [Bacteroidales bacterium]|nr:type I DNA topoisomerase [Bacteroidales bacterium]MBR6868949.1 type I DNA topoisomerase [Bacteroidales bacterium]
MSENLVIVESPAKARTIEKFLGKGYTVKSSFGHIRDLKKKGLGIDIENGFLPQYEISSDKKKTVSELKTAAGKADTVWLASDEDREGEAIAWHLAETLSLDPEKTRRIVFHEITKNAILDAIENPRDIDMNLVKAQQARRVLDRLVGFELSPILWKKIQPKLSAGRVQSVALRLIVDREREISAFEAKPYFRVEGVFYAEGSKKPIHATLDRKFDTEDEARAFLERCRGEEFHIASVDKREARRSPAPPFTTSTLQQEAARKLGYSVSQTMSIAQRLYEAGLITYMRTDSMNLSTLALGTTKEVVTRLYGAPYAKTRNYHTHTKGAQEAHEAIRPTYVSNLDIEGTATEKRLYNLIWKRTVACQMADAVVEKTDVEIRGSRIAEKFLASGEQILFDGFLKVYIEGRDDEESENLTVLPTLGEGQLLNCNQISAIQKYTQHLPRYSEASLVKKLEELGIGRPSTYASTVSTLITRGYIIKGDKPGLDQEVCQLDLRDGQITRSVRHEKTGAEKKKLLPENIGIVVTDFLAANFADILDYGFTAQVEESFDKVAKGRLSWDKVISDFYGPFHKEVDGSLQDQEHTRSERLIGYDPASGKPISARIGRFGPLLQKGASDDPDKQFVSLRKGQLIETITLEDALQLFALPRVVGHYGDAEITTAIGRFGPYVKYDGHFVSLAKGQDPYTLTEEQAIALIEESRNKETKKVIADFPDAGIQILNGRYGPYLKKGKENYRIPKKQDAASLTLEDCLAIISKAEKKK